MSDSSASRIQRQVKRSTTSDAAAATTSAAPAATGHGIPLRAHAAAGGEQARSVLELLDD